MADLTTFQQTNGGAPAAQFMDGSGFNASEQSVAAPASAPVVAPAAAPVSNPVVGTSTNYRADINNLGNNITGAQTNSPLASLPGADTNALAAAYNGFAGDLKTQQDTLAQRRDADIAQINSSFDNQKASTELTQKNETGATSSSLARIGGYLGDSASGNGALLGLQQRHTQELQTIETQRAAALNQAQTAYEDKNFALAQQKYTEAKDLLGTIYQRQKDFADLSLQYQQFQNTKDQQQLVRQQAAQDFALKYNIPANKPFYSIGGTVYRTSDQKAAPTPQDYVNMGGKGDSSDIFSLTGNAAAERDQVAAIAKDYPDAGISPNDTLASATAKLQNSELYQVKTAGKFQKYTDSNGNDQFFNTTNNTSTNFGDQSGNTSIAGFGQPKPGGWRTDNNGNPIAAAISTSSSGNEFTKALDAAGIAWTKGSPFEDNPSMSSIKILGDPIEGARAILSNSNAIQEWYVNHTGSGILPQLGVKNNSDFKNLSTDDQNKVIAGIYKAEGGTGQLLAQSPSTQSMVQQGSTTNAVGTTGSPAIDATAPDYATKALPNSGGLTQSAVDQQAMKYLLDGSKPPRGAKGPALQQNKAILNRMGEMDAGGNIAAHKAQLSVLTKTLGDQTDYLNTTQRSVQNAEDGFNQLTTAFQDKGLNPSESKYANAKLNDIRNFFGDNTQARYAFDAGLTEVANEYSQVFSRGGQVSDTVRNKSASILDGSMSLKDLMSIQNELQAQGKIVINGTQYQVNKIQDEINNIISPGKAKASVSTPPVTLPNDLKSINFFGNK